MYSATAPAPLSGRRNEEVLGTLLGLAKEEIQKVQARRGYLRNYSSRGVGNPASDVGGLWVFA